MCSAYQDNMHVTVGAKCMLYTYQNKGSMHSVCSRSNRQVTCMFHVSIMTWLMHVLKVYVLSISYRYSESLNVKCMLTPPHLDLYVYMYMYTRMSTLESDF